MQTACFCGELFQGPQCPRCGRDVLEYAATSGNYFMNPHEANDWLPFDSAGFDREVASWTENDCFEEWLIWRTEYDI